MNIAYWLAVTVVGIFFWIVCSMTIFPLIQLLMPFMHPVYWEKWLKKLIINHGKNVLKYIYVHVIMRVLLILFCLCVFIIFVAYFIYFVAKYILLKELITAPIGKAILQLPIIKEFIEFGVFPFFDKIFAYQFPALYGGSPKGPMKSAVINFTASFLQKIKDGDGSKKAGRAGRKPEPEKPGEVKNPNLTDDQNKAVNSKFDKCIKDNTPGAYNGLDPIKLLLNQLKTSNATIKCEVIKFKDYTEVKRVK